MTHVAWLLTVQGVIGGFDTLYYHEWRARLPAHPTTTASELKLHATRDFLYAVLFGTLPWWAWQGIWTLVLAVVLIAEVLFTLIDFVVEIRVRRNLGDVYAGERITHAIMGIVYGAMLANLIPHLVQWWTADSRFLYSPIPIPELRCLLALMAFGVTVSGIRDLYAAYGLPNGGWPWSNDLTRS
jgi:hypothetical protein